MKSYSLFSHIFAQKNTSFNFQKKDTFVVSRRGGLPNYSTLNDIVNQLTSILLTEGFLSISGSLHLDFNNREDPCCDSTAVISLSGRENLYRNSSKGRRQLSCRWPNHGVHDQPRVEHPSGTTAALPPNCAGHSTPLK